MGADVAINLKYTLSQIKTAKSKSANIVHFSECNLSGYGGIDFFSYEKLDLSEILSAIEQIRNLAKNLEIGVVMGTHFYEETGAKPKNALIYINRYGIIETRYEKRILFGAEDTHEYLYYSPGSIPVVFTIDEIKCGMMICHEWRYAELIRAYKKLGVKMLFHSWYEGGLSKDKYANQGIHNGELIIGSTKGYAANNYLWISGSNTCKKESCFPSFVMRPDGRIANKSRRNIPGVLVTHIDFDQKFDDPSFFGRKRFL